ncbi:hypothetical protein Osc7112_5595 [Oscillatoria nigro-viridis PCC 7112]|uniref:Uncharacterized protein n=1 Tax=Phormidium nigroviride PCC 7112 TaxID=179408 RepID=K9VNZ1_9CYAN|nr:hypothetical protein [Oscillatoria nigro-viridis]AFZ09818.1 hypothetical protein Osc7112_5595 [Oscillatoria nigro-viridis PCC 7112]
MREVNTVGWVERQRTLPTESTVRYAEYLRYQGYDAIATRSPEMMQYYLVFDPKQVVVVKE